MDDIRDLICNTNIGILDQSHLAIVFKSNGVEGKLFVKNGKWDFEGDATGSAEIFFNEVLKNLNQTNKVKYDE